MATKSRTVHLTRRVGFSSGHRYWNSTSSAEENRALFGPWASPFNHGHNYVLDVTVAGKCDPVTGMVVNIKSLDALLDEAIVAKFDQRSINDEVAEFAEKPPSLENVIACIKSTLSPDAAIELDGQSFELEALRLEEMPGFWADLNPKTMTTTLTRSYEFSASHRLHVHDYSESQNFELFGKCNNAAGHGHNYVLEVTVGGQADARTGMLVDLGALDTAVNRLVVERYDHKNLNVDMPEFANHVPTTEILALEAFGRLNGKLPAILVGVKIYETARSSFEVRGD